MNKCLNCGKDVKQVEGRRERKFCDNNNKCKGEYHRKQQKTPRYVLASTYKKLEAEFLIIKAERDNLLISAASGVNEDENKTNTAPKKEKGVSNTIKRKRNEEGALEAANRELDEALGKPDVNSLMTLADFRTLSWQDQAAYRIKHGKNYKKI